jgi:hypothetical protein
MSHPLVLALFDNAVSAASAARDLRAMGLPRERVSIVARSHDEEGELARASGGSPGSEIEDSAPASRLGELSGHLLAAIAVVMPGIGPIVADGPLAAGLGEAAGHLAGGMTGTLEAAGLSHGDAEAWVADIDRGWFLIGAHATADSVESARATLVRNGAARITAGVWPD